MDVFRMPPLLSSYGVGRLDASCTYEPTQGSCEFSFLRTRNTAMGIYPENKLPCSVLDSF